MGKPNSKYLLKGKVKNTVQAMGNILTEATCIELKEKGAGLLYLNEVTLHLLDLFTQHNDEVTEDSLRKVLEDTPNTPTTKQEGW